MPSSNSVLREVVESLKDVFRRATHKRAAHHLARPILQRASREPGFFTEALAAYLRSPESFNRLNYPVLSIPIVANPYFELVINCWIPLPDGRTDVTTKAIHHHGDMLLSTVTIFGPGYEHWLFTRPRLKEGQPDPLVHTMSAVDVRAHGLSDVAFVDDYVPHVPLFPKTLSLTLALWSSQHDVSLLDRVKRIPILKKNSVPLRSVLVRLGLRKALDLKVPEYFDFFPVEGGFQAMKVRKEFDLGPNEDHLQSLFHVISATGNAGLAPVISSTLATGTVQQPALVESMRARLLAGEVIEGKLSPGHYEVPFANFRRAEIDRSLATRREGVPPAIPASALPVPPVRPSPLQKVAHGS